MKNLGWLLAPLLIVTPLIASCMLHHDQIAGSGKQQREKREVAPFTSISTEGAYEIEIDCRQQQSLEIEGDDNILPLITTEVSNGVLRIRNKRSFSVNRPIVLKIMVPNLEGISAAGAGRIKVSGLQNNRFEIDSSGAPAIDVSGETKVLDIKANGACKVDAHKLRATKAIVEANGVAKVEVFATEQLDVEVSGPGQVIYSGNPKVNKTVNGPGSVTKKESEGA